VVVLAVKVRKMFIDRHITSKKLWIIYATQIFRNWAVGAFLLLNIVAAFIKTGTNMGLMFFIHVRSSLSKHVKQY